MIILRPDQATLQGQCFDGWRAGAQDVMAVLATGGGKSVIVSDTVRKFDDNRQSSLISAHRQELVGQMSLHIARQGVRHRIFAPKPIVQMIMAKHRQKLNGQCYVDPSARAAVAGVDTIMSRADELAEYLKQVDLMVTDEGHHLLRENKWGKVRAMCPRALGLEVTATPERADGKGLGRHADGVIDLIFEGPQMRDLINMGALCEYEIVCPVSDFDLDGLKTGENGDYTNASMKAAAEKSHIVGDVVENYCKEAYGKKAVVFATDVATALKMAERFNAAGIPAAAISGTTHDTVRDDVIERLTDGRLWVVVNVDLLGEGFDLPAIEVVIMARPTASLAVYLQQFGRALRTVAGKLFGLVIDHVSNIIKHKFPDKPRVWSLNRREGRGKSKEKDPELIPVIRCKKCTKPYEAVRHSCPHCGAVPPPPGQAGGRGALEEVMGDLARLDVATLARMRQATELLSPAAKAAEVLKQTRGNTGAEAGALNVQYALIEAQDGLKRALSEWAGYQRWKGRQDSEIHIRFFHATGIDILTALSTQQTRNDYLKLTERVKSWLPTNG